MRSKRHSTGSSLDGPTKSRNRSSVVNSPPSPTRGFARPTMSSSARNRHIREEQHYDRRDHHRNLNHISDSNQLGNSSVAVAVSPPGRRRESEDHQSLEHHEMTCDYDKSATILYELLEASSWDEAIRRCRDNPDEARTWIVRKDKSMNIRWKLLPLHASIIFQAPTSVASSILDAYRLAARRQDDQGMLPLHLAFRHKQEDEDLLDSLLREYPKAVLERDKRNRVPLEHGRDLKFSSKIMRVYAETYVEANERGTHDASPQNTNKYLSHQEIHAESPRNEGHMMLIRQKHKEELQRLRKQYEDKIKTTKEQMEREAKQSKQAAANERQALIDRHQEELAELRELLSTQAGRENTMMHDLQAQIDDLQTALENASVRNDEWADRCKSIEAYSSELRLQLHKVVQDQLFIRDLADQQNKELDSARKIRRQILTSLMEQEDREGHNEQVWTKKLIELAETAKDRVQNLIEKDLGVNQQEESRGPSRVEMERVNDNSNSKLDEEGVHNRMGKLNIKDEVEIRGTGQMGDDEISAITENSP